MACMYVSKISINVLSKLHQTENSINSEQTSVDPDEAAHTELPHQNLCCLQSPLLSFLALKKITYEIQAKLYTQSNDNSSLNIFFVRIMK